MTLVLGIVFFTVLGLAVTPAFFWVAGLFLLALFIAEVSS